MHRTKDITHDFGLMDYLFNGIIPGNPDELARILKLVKKYRAHGGELQRKLP